MNEQEQALERKLRRLQDQVTPPTHLQSSIEQVLATEAGTSPSRRPPWTRIAMAAALAVIATTAISVWLIPNGDRARAAEESLEARLELVRAEVESIIAALEAERPEDAGRLSAEFDRVIASMSEIAGQIARGRNEDSSGRELAMLMHEQLLLVDLAVSLQIDGTHTTE